MADTTAPQQVSPAIHTDTSSAPTSGGKTTSTTTTTTTYLQPQPIAIPSTPGSSSANHHNLTDPNSNNCNNSAQDIISPISPSKSIGRKTGTRSTFCPNTLRKCTKLTDEDFDHHENDSAQNYQGQSTGWLGMLGLKKNANYGDELSKYNEPHEQAYY
ncbi:hypothetical protein BGZ97_000566 [Linnemannia gamsii]|jgi:hypothetical protein|uniref:Uncharacterized protein n=1 Tax=Linnemannia gamsii TaxID=64522 RepID=A0A9P6UUG0_9FUNG|nr:hypothetical protein BGZ97_000566 [Linnemannia gamsii]